MRKRFVDFLFERLVPFRQLDPAVSLFPPEA